MCYNYLINNVLCFTRSKLRLLTLIYLFYAKAGLVYVVLLSIIVRWLQKTKAEGYG